MLVLLGALGTGGLLWVAKDYLFTQSSNNEKSFSDTKLLDKKKQEEEQADEVNNFVKIMEKQNRKIIFFYGSQTGNAENYCYQLSKECKKRFNIQPMVADIETYDLKYLDLLTQDNIVVFVVSTYGEGDPTDSAINFWELIHKDQPNFSKCDGDSQPLKQLRYFAFGLGNSTYEHFNAAVLGLDKQLTRLGATRLGQVGTGDDDGCLDDDFTQWQESFWPLFGQVISEIHDDNQEEGNSGSQHAYQVSDANLESDPFYYHGELGDQRNAIQQLYNAKNPYPATIQIRDLTPTLQERHCLHIDVDLADSGLTYTTGDHLGVWPINNESEVNLVSSIFGWEKNNLLDKVIAVTPTDPTGKPPFPQPTTLRTALRHYLDIASIPSKSVFELLVPYITNDNIKAGLQRFIDDKEVYRQVVVDEVRNLGQVLAYLLKTTTSDDSDIEAAFEKVPIHVVLECYTRLQPRYYSISSSSSESKSIVTATAVTLQYNPTPDRVVYGVNTNYLWSIYQKLYPSLVASDNSPNYPVYAIEGPHQSYFKVNDDQSIVSKLPVHIRQSGFRLPADSSVPIVMVGPGTGVAPFRGFVRERVYQKQQQQKVGTTLLFFGCRRSNEDFLYSDEWPELFNQLNDNNNGSRIITAFSRETDQKVYVQHRVRECGEEVWRLLAKEGGYLYVCGDAKHMAKDITKTVVDLAKQYGQYDDEEAALDFVKELRKAGRYQEDVWA
ncbi:hypothetical protein BJ944DRAFT_256704 [Cunninghamella echinulata]|nr:hypothetical protein BJ944DRAFT_256704 [Cunninghamella echinulata]